MPTTILISSISTLLYLFLFSAVAKKISLVDKPNNRKHHQGEIPLVGGLAIFTTILQFLYFNPLSLEHSSLYSISIFVLMIVGILDDKFDLNFKIRLGVQTFLAVLMVYVAHIHLHNIGNILGVGSISLNYISLFTTIIFVIGGMNAFNMMDGIDGLLGSLACITLSSLAFLLFLLNIRLNLAIFSLIVVSAIIPYILYNLGAFRKKRKIFLGDVGSMSIGFTIIWLLLDSSQNNNQTTIQPTTGLWLIAIPLMDMGAVVIRRIKKGHSPFKADRTHLHHIIQRFGFNPRWTLLIICIMSLCSALWGIIGEVYNIPEPIMFWSFVICFVLYLFSLMRIWTVSKFVRKFIAPSV